jgi:hypothetical protein
MEEEAKIQFTITANWRREDSSITTTQLATVEVLQRFASGVKILALQKSIVPKCLRIKGRVFGKTATSASFYARSEKLQHFPAYSL